MSEAPKAVFLSYASQDTEAAKRIADALRASGIEVWFDVEGGLETGDEWDAKIRRQIKECVLFLPVISANTQARDEGYFRIEWDLAAERARGIASGVPFILPIVIDDTREPNALVPDRFRSVQWTRAPGGELPAATQAKFAKLWSHRAGLAKHRAAETSGATTPLAEPSPVQAGRSPKFWVGLGLGALALGVGAFFFQQSRSPKTSAPLVPAPAPAPTSTAIPSARAWPTHPELKRAMTLLDGLQTIPEDVRLAEEIVQRVLDANPTDPESVTAMARVHSMWLLRGWDRSLARYQKAKATAERALQLAPDEPEAYIALATYLYSRGTESQRAVDLAQRAVDLYPQEPRFHRMRDNCLWVRHVQPASVFSDNTGEQENEGLRLALASARRTVELFPRDPLVRYELSRHYRDIGRWDDFERVNDEVLALAPVANAMVWKARARFGLHGDLPGMKAVLDQVPARVRGIERTVFGYFIYSAFTGNTAEGLEALSGMADSWMIDFDYRGPKALPTAALLELGGKKELARVQYETALVELLRARPLNAEDSTTYLNEAWIKRGLGRLDEARAALRVYNEALPRPYQVSPLGTWWFQAISANLLLGEKETALALIREACSIGGKARDTIRSRLALDPRLASFRDDPQITALLAESASAAISAPAPVAAPLSEGEQLATRALALAEKLSFSREDLGTADDLARRAIEKEPDSAKAWGARAWVQAAWIMRNWDVSEKRRQDTQNFANRALSLDPNQPEALYALAYVFRSQGALDQAETTLRKALAAAPDNPRIARTLCNIIARAGRQDEAVALLTELTKRFPSDPLIRYELAQMFANYGFNVLSLADVDTAAHWLDETIALQPFANALTFRALIAAAWHDDYAMLRAKFAQLAELPLGERTDDRTIALVMWGNLLDGRYDEVRSAGALTANTSFEDSVLAYPHKPWLVALARERQGKPNLARVEWENAEPLLRQRLAAAPGNAFRQAELAITLARVGKREEARELMGKIEPAWREDLTRVRPMILAQFYASLADAAKSVEYLRPIVDRSLYTTRHTLRRDPWWDKIRDSAEFKALLSEPAKLP